MILALLLVVIWALSGHAQNAIVRFSYDANGNRISRTLNIRKVMENGKAIDSLDLPAVSNKINDIFGNAELTLYPNPTHDRVTVVLKGMDGSSAQARLVATTGAILQQCKLAEGIHELDLSELPAGVYLLQLSTANVSQTWKIIKE